MAAKSDAIGDESDFVDQPAEPAQRDDSAARWMFNGVLLGVLLVGSANALSFFFRSEGWGGLLGEHHPSDEAIGFPLTIWQESGGYGMHAMRGDAFLACLGLAVLIGAIAGRLAIIHRQTLNQILTRLSSPSRNEFRIQFSLQGMMFVTVLVAVAAAVVITPRVEVLAAIYLLGPALSIGIAFVPRRFNWQQRIAILVPTVFSVIAIAITLGNLLNVEFDKVLLGIFICWTPQAAFGAIALTAWIMYREYRSMTALVSQ